MALLPHSYFRFLSLRSDSAWEKLAKTIAESQLHAARVTDFNDPFEANPVIIGGKDKKLEINFNLSGNANWSPLITPLLKTFNDQQRTIGKVIEHLKGSLSVVSFSRRVNSGLLWGHYTSGYRGVALYFVPTNATGSLSRTDYSIEIEW